MTKADFPPDLIERNPRRHLIALVAGPLLALLMLSAPAPEGLPVPAWRTLAITSWIVVWWLSEAIPIPATAMIPIAFFPMLDIVDLKTTSQNYAHPLLLMFLGGFMLAAAMQRCGLHRRIALTIISMVGTSPSRIIAGFMLATGLLSMWISNTATTLMMVAVALPVIKLHSDTAASAKDARNFSISLLLAVAYSASIGGLGTPIGTPPNALLISILNDSYNIKIDFATWMTFGLPVVALMLPLTWLMLTRVLFPVGQSSTNGPDSSTIDDELKALGPAKRTEKMVLAVFLLAAFGWLVGAPIARSYGIPVSDTAVAIIAALLLFTLPSRLDKPEFLLDWESTRDIPWGVLIMLGGGLAIATGFASSGLAQAIGDGIARFSGLGLWLFVLIAIAAIVFLTELTSNTASAATFLPILGAIAVGMGYDPRVMLIPVTLGASMAFMMPVATAPNAIVFSHPAIKINDMVRTGFWLNLIAIAVCFTVGYAMVSWMIGDPAL